MWLQMPYLVFFLLQTNSKKIMKPRFVSWRMWCYLWSKVICPWGLLSPSNYRKWHIGYAQKWFFLTKQNLLMMCFLDWWRKPCLPICILHLQIIFQPLAPLTYGCQKVCMMCLLLLLIFYLTNGRPSTSLSDYLMCPTLVVQLWLQGNNNF